jgi:uncharacterized protein YigA (DUF484 family)
VTAPNEGIPVDALEVISQLERMIGTIARDLAVARARIDKLEAEKAELEREARVREATS